MKLTTACLTLGLTGVLAAASPAIAGDLSNGGAGGIKDYSYGGSAVPAPVPYEENFKWYVRGDLGTAFKSQGTIGNDGMPVNFTQPGDWHEQTILSFGFGKYITPSIRAEATIDYRTQRDIGSKNPLTATTSVTATNGVSTDTNLYQGSQVETTNYQNSTFLLSAFYDFNNRSKFTPYVGAGIGIARHELTRNGSETYNCIGGNGLAGACNYSTGLLAPSYIANSNGISTGYGLAAQLSAGLSYAITPRTHWDTGYRMLWQGGRVGLVSDGGAFSNGIRIADHTEHEIRTGIRWDIW